MNYKKVLVHASQALFAAVALMWFVAGCDRRKEDTRPEVYPAEGHAYMKDPAFKAVLAAQEKKRNTLMAERDELVQAFAELEKRAGSRSAAEKLPEWQALDVRMRACGRAYESNRWETTEILRVRMERARADSARVARGEAKAKEISK